MTTMIPVRLHLCLLLVLAYATTSCLGDSSSVTERQFEAVDFKGKKPKKGDSQGVWDTNDQSLVYLGDKKTWIKWNVDVTTAGEHVLTFRHLNLLDVDMNVVLNDEVQTSVLFGRARWGDGRDGWSTTSTAAIPLQEGVNAIVLKPSGNGGTVVDKIMTVEFTFDGEQTDPPTVDDTEPTPVDDSDPGNAFVTVIHAQDSKDHTLQIQGAIDSLSPHDALHLLGDFTIFRTIYFPSDFTWRLDGTLKLGKNATLDKIGWRPAAITEKPGGATNIHMTGGYYDGNRHENVPDVRLINFLYVKDSYFSDMRIDSAGDDNFSLGHSTQYNQVHNLVSRYAGGNGLTDKGSYNKWYDCEASFCDSDGWTPKSQYSEFHRCVARENEGPGFGLYARTDQADVNLGAKLNGNSFIEIEAYCNKRSGISFNIAKNCGPGAELIDNHVQGYFYKNGRSGVEFTNMLEDGKIINNSMDVVGVENYGWSSSTLLGAISVKVGGLAAPGMNGVADQVTGYFVGYGNNPSANTDVNIGQATNSEIMVYETDPKPQVVGNANWQPTSITCPAQESDEWRVRKYCEMKAEPYKCVRKWQ